MFVPKVSIGFPVRNGGLQAAEALRSLLAQTFSDFELIISDNASTDRTGEICRSFADPRIRYIRQPADLGPVANFRFVMEQASGEFFMWAAADDLWHPRFIEENLRVLEQFPNIVGSISRVKMGEEEASHHNGCFAISGAYLRRLRQFLAAPGDNSRCYSLFRRKDLLASFVDGEFIAFDWAIMLNVLKRGSLYEVDEILMWRATDGLSRRPNYQGRYLFLREFTTWFWRTAGWRNFAACLDLILRLNVRNSRPWILAGAAKRALKAAHGTSVAAHPGVRKQLPAIRHGA